MPTDALIQLQASTTKTATFNGSAVTLNSGTPRRGLVARVLYTANSANTGGDTVTFDIDVSYDGGSTWLADFVAPPLAQPTTANSGEIFIPFSISPTSIGGSTQVRLTATFSSTAHANTITYVGDLMQSRP